MSADVRVIETGALQSILQEVKAAMAADAPATAERPSFADLLAEVQQALENDSVLTGRDDLRFANEVEELIPKITARIETRHQALRSQLEANAPWALVPLDWELDLLSPLARVDHEPTHTRVLAYLLDPNRPHGLGVRVLREFFALLGRLIPGADTFERISVEAPETIETLRRVQVRAEEIVKTPERESRCDLWLELVDESKTLIVVVENKIEASEHGDQLSAYEEAVWHRGRARRRLNLEAKLVFLTPKGHLPAQDFDRQLWLPMSYIQLAGALARASRDAPEPGRTFLNLYTASILRMRGIPSAVDGIARLRQLPYLNEVSEPGGYRE